ncbi:MAG: bifunctional riboflavin kinase/FAD synthetase [Gemmataceae bacterium]
MALQVVEWAETPPEFCQHGAVTVGNFDGAHRGHAKLIQTLTSIARPAVVLTFDPHPLTLLRPDQAPPLLTTLDDRAEYLHQLGADHVVVLRTTPELLQLSAEDFFRQILQTRLHARAIVEGPNFRFGRNRTGDVEHLERWCLAAGIALHIVELQLLDGHEVSSSAIRRALAEGRLTEALAALGRPYRLRGLVGHGARRGRSLGFPTANLEGTQTLVPAYGVYAARAKGYPAAVHIGPNPTFGEAQPKIEAHLIGFSGDLYGQELVLEIVARLREVRRFASAEELRNQLRQDIENARKELER